MGRAAYHRGGPQHPLPAQLSREKAEKYGGCRGGFVDSGGLSGLSAPVRPVQQLPQTGGEQQNPEGLAQQFGIHGGGSEGTQHSGNTAGDNGGKALPQLQLSLPETENAADCRCGQEKQQIDPSRGRLVKRKHQRQP